MTNQERVLRRSGANEHILQLFDTPESLGNVVSAFLNDGWEAGDRLLVIAKPKHWSVTLDRLRRRGFSVADAKAQERLTVLDAYALLQRFMRGPVPDGSLFHQTLGTVMEGVSPRSPRGLRIYGEPMELLAEEGNFEGARLVEALWNELRQERLFTLLCGYSAAHFADAGAASALRALSDAHARVQRRPSDTLGSWLLDDQRAEAADAG